MVQSPPPPTREFKSQNEFEYLTGQIGEFLDCYILLGYDLGGNAVNIFVAKNPQHYDSISNLIFRTADNLADSGRANPQPPDE